VVGLERHWGFKLHKAPEVMLSSFVSFYFSDLCFYAIQFSHSVMSDSLQSHEPQHTRSPCPSQPQSPLKPMSIELVMPSNHLVLFRPLLLLPSIFASIRVFSSESALRTRCPEYWSFSFSISSFNEYSGLSSFRIDWLDLLAVQGTLKSVLQHHTSKAFFSAQLSLWSNSHIHT